MKKTPLQKIRKPVPKPTQVIPSKKRRLLDGITKEEADRVIRDKE